jgi:pyruvate kinase
VYRQMALVWGVTPLLVPEYASTDEMIESTTRAAREAGLIKPGERVVITAGIPAGGEGQTNMLKVHVI